MHVHDTPITIISVDVNGTSVADPKEKEGGRKKEKAQSACLPVSKGGSSRWSGWRLRLSLSPPLSISPFQFFSTRFFSFRVHSSPPFSLSRLSFSTGELVSRACHASTEVKTVRFSFSRPFPRHFFFNGGRLILEEAKRRERPVGRVWARARRVMSPRPAKILVASFLALSPRTLAKERDPRNR